MFEEGCFKLVKTDSSYIEKEYTKFRKKLKYYGWSFEIIYEHDACNALFKHVTECGYTYHVKDQQEFKSFERLCAHTSLKVVTDITYIYPQFFSPELFLNENRSNYIFKPLDKDEPWDCDNENCLLSNNYYTFQDIIFEQGGVGAVCRTDDRFLEFLPTSIKKPVICFFGEL